MKKRGMEKEEKTVALPRNFWPSILLISMREIKKKE